MQKYMLFSLTVLSVVFLSSCEKTTEPTITQSQSATDYMLNGKSGTVYTFNVRYIRSFNAGKNLDTMHSKHYLTILSSDTSISVSNHAMKIERKIPFASSWTFYTDTLYYYIKDNSLYQYALDFNSGRYRTSKILIGSVQIGDSVGFDETSIKTGKVISVNEPISVPYGTIKAMHLQSQNHFNTVLSNDTLKEIWESDAYYSASLLQVKARSLRSIFKQGILDSFQDYTLELESVK